MMVKMKERNFRNRIILLLLITVSYFSTITNALSVFPGGKSAFRQQSDSPPLVLGGGNRRPFQLSGKNAAQLTDMIERRNFSLLINLQQQRGTEGTLVSVFSRPGVRTFDIYLDGKQKLVRVAFRTQTGSLEVLSGEADLADGNWHQMIFEIKDDKLQLLVDCHKVLGGVYPEMDFSEMGRSYARPRIWIGQLSRHLSHFSGKLKEFSANPGSLSLIHCNKEEKKKKEGGEGEEEEGERVKNELKSTGSQTIHKHEHNNRQGNTTASKKSKRLVSYLNHRVRYLENEFKKWREVVNKHETQLQYIHLHQRGCELKSSDGNILLGDGERWLNESSCTECVCHRGESHCKPKGCPKLTCKSPIMDLDGKGCCPKCGKRCFYMGKYYEHGHTYWPKKCVKCNCFDGEMRCNFERQECPQLSCPKTEQKTVGNQCCPICNGQDFCSSKPCHPNATCTNEEHQPKCVCKDGFFGSGYECYDIDECLWTAEMTPEMGGCGKGTRCINIPGSFRCECLPGYMKIGNSKTCIDVVLV